MPNHRLLFTSLVFVVAIAALHVVASRYYLYWTMWWFDIPMHVLGGMWISIMTLWLLVRLRQEMREKWQAVIVFLMVIGVGVLWELFEAGYLDIMHEPGYVFDTLSDLLNDLCGGALGYLLALPLARPLPLEPRLS